MGSRQSTIPETAGTYRCRCSTIVLDGMRGQTEEIVGLRAGPSAIASDDQLTVLGSTDHPHVNSSSTGWVAITSIGDAVDFVIDSSDRCYRFLHKWVRSA
jgi:hypothetical protein